MLHIRPTIERRVRVRAVLAVALVAALAPLSSLAADPPKAGAPVDISNFATIDALKDVTLNQAARDALPAKIRDAGRLSIGGSTHLPPYLSMKDGKYAGIEANFMAALARTLGLRIDIVDTPFSAMIIGLTSGRIDVAMSDFTDTVERQQQVDFVDYTKSGTVLITQKGNPKAIKALADLCGNSVAGSAGSTAVQIAKGQSNDCVASGKKPVDVQSYPTSAEVQLAVSNRRADSAMYDLAIAKYIVTTQPDRVQVGGPSFHPNLHGAALAKHNTELKNAMVISFDALIASGVYQKILDAFDVSEMAIPKAIINGAK